MYVGQGSGGESSSQWERPPQNMNVKMQGAVRGRKGHRKHVQSCLAHSRSSRHVSFLFLLSLLPMKSGEMRAISQGSCEVK